MKIIELFAGVGSQTQALKNIGIEHEVVGISEIDKYAIKSYNAIHGKTHNFGDIKKIDTLPYADLWTYSSPCQDFSVAGKQAGIRNANGEITRSGLLLEVERLLEVSEKPKYLLLENVKNLVGKKFRPDFERWLSRLKELGYHNYWKVINAKDYGVPQNRERVFVVSIRKDFDAGYVFPSKQVLTRRLKDVLGTSVDDKFYLSKEKVNNLLKKIDVYEKTTEPRILQIPHGFNKGNIYNIAPTITSNGSYQHNNFVIYPNGQSRRLTPKECWRLMGFKDEQFEKAEKVNSNTQLYKQAGNSIVVNVLEEIFNNLFLKNN